MQDDPKHNGTDPAAPEVSEPDGTVPPAAPQMRESGLDYVAWLRKQGRGDSPREPEREKPLNPAVDPPFYI